MDALLYEDALNRIEKPPEADMIAAVRLSYLYMRNMFTYILLIILVHQFLDIAIFTHVMLWQIVSDI